MAAPLPVGAARVLALRVLFGARNGLLYGIKVRAPHAAVLTALWARGTWREKAAAVGRATATHAAQLGAYAALYKTLFNALALAERHVTSPHSARLAGASGVGEAGAPRRAAVAGALAGSVVFAKPSSINQQILMFLFSRAVVGAARTLAAHTPAPLRASAWQLFAGGCWAAVMALWEHDKRVLAPGLVSSMDFIYSDADAADAAAAAAVLRAANGVAAGVAPPAGALPPPRSFAELMDARAWRAALMQR